MPYENGVWVNNPTEPEPTTQVTGLLSNIQKQYDEVLSTYQQDPTYDYYDPQKVTDTIDNQIDYKAPKSYISPESTVASQLTALLDSNSAYIKQARTSAAETAQERGLLNSSMAAGAGEAAAIKAALPIAQQDATLHSKADLMRQDKEYNTEYAKSQAIISSDMVEQEAKIRAKDTKLQNTFVTSMAGADASKAVWMGDIKNSYDKSMFDLKSQQEKLINNSKYNAVTAEGVRNQTSTVMQSYQVSVENLLMDPDFMQLGSKAMNKAINELQTLAKNSINFISNSSGVDLTAYVDMYIGDIEVF